MGGKQGIEKLGYQSTKLVEWMELDKDLVEMDKDLVEMDGQVGCPGWGRKSRLWGILGISSIFYRA